MFNFGRKKEERIRDRAFQVMSSYRLSDDDSSHLIMKYGVEKIDANLIDQYLVDKTSYNFYKEEYKKYYHKTNDYYIEFAQVNFSKHIQYMFTYYGALEFTSGVGIHKLSLFFNDVIFSSEALSLIGRTGTNKVVLILPSMDTEIMFLHKIIEFCDGKESNDTLKFTSLLGKEYFR